MVAGPAPLVEAFTAGLGAAAAKLDAGATARALQAALDAGRAEWPELPLEAEAFAAELAQRVSSSAEPLQALERLCASDLFAVVAVARGVPGALPALEARYFPDIARTAATIDKSPAFADEVQQVLRERLFVPKNGALGIAQYAGKGSLAAWLRISTLRVAARLREGKDRETDLERLEKLSERALGAAGSDPEVELLKKTYREEFRRAFYDALSELTARERNLLRLHTLDRLTGEQIAEFYRVSGATTSRWLQRARDTLHARTRELLGERLGLGPSQLDSLAGLVLSQLDLSLGRVLGE
jgi:RNA polymerase sigma-70 factor (ECF subfamily)